MRIPAVTRQLNSRIKNPIPYRKKNRFSFHLIEAWFISWYTPSGHVRKNNEEGD